jgi:hypothetical protein
MPRRDDFNVGQLLRGQGAYKMKRKEKWMRRRRGDDYDSKLLDAGTRKNGL